MGIGDVVLFACLERVVELPQILESRRRRHSLPGRGLSPLSRSIVHDGDSWMQGPDQGLGAGTAHSVMTCQVDGHVPHRVIGAHQVEFLVPSQVTQVDEPEVAEGQQYSNRASVLARIISLALYR